MPTRHYSNVAVPTTITAAIDAVQTTMTVAALTGYPTQFPYTVVLERNEPSKAEIIDVVAATDLTLTIVRGRDNTTAQTHPVNSLVTHDHSARDYVETQDRLDRLEGQSHVDFTKAFLFGVTP